MNTTTPSDGTTAIDSCTHPEKSIEDEGQGQLEHFRAGEMTSMINDNKSTQSHDRTEKPSSSLASPIVKRKIEDDDGGDAEDEEDEDDDDADSVGSAHAKTKTGKRRRSRGDEDVPMTFPQKLMEILSNEDHVDIISWLPHGRGFMIYQKKKFATEIMPKHFKKSKFTSFTRKLNRWNFTRITRGPETGAYYHEFFQRGNLRLCMQMCCQNSKSNPPMQQSLSMPEARGLMGPNSVRDAMSGLHLGTTDLGVGGMGSQAADLSSLLQNQLQGAGSFGTGGGFVGMGGVDDQLQQRLRQLEQQRDLVLQQQQQQQQLATLGFNLGGAGLGSNNNAGSSDMSLGALQRSNTNAYLAMLMAQEKVQAQMAALGQTSSVSPMDFQRQQANLLQAQQHQLEQYNQQRLLQAQATALQQQNSNCNDLPPHILNALGLFQGQQRQQRQQEEGSGGADERGKIKRGASAA